MRTPAFKRKWEDRTHRHLRDYLSRAAAMLDSLSTRLAQAETAERDEAQ